MALTQAQFDELNEIANSGQSGARVTYYTKLAEFGVTYGNLALGVVLEDQISGRVANSYFMAVAEQEGVSVSAQQWSAIGNALMLADLDARLNSQQVADDGTVSYPDLGYQPIRDYHAEVFSTLGGTVPDGDGVSINGWTAYAPVETYGAGKWDEMLTASQLGQAAGGAWMLFQMAWEARNGDSPLAIQWASMIALPAFEAPLAGGSPAAFPDAIDGAHIVLGTLADDTLSIPAGTPVEDTVIVMGLGGDDTISVQGHGDLFDGGSGDDTFVVTAMDGELIHGSTGRDKVDFSGLSQSVQFDADAGTASVYSGYDWASIRSIEDIAGTSYNDSFVFSSSLAAVDTQSIDAGAGIDTIFLYNAVEQLHVDLEDGRVLGVNEIAAIGFENVVGGEAGDTLLGSIVANDIKGGPGDDQIEGRAGDDSLWGQLGDDRMLGGDGEDELHGGYGNDVLRGDGGNDNLYGDEGADNLDGGDGDDWIYGHDDSDHLWGGAGKDYLYGGGGDDFLFGGAGNDSIDGGDGYNIVTGGVGEDWFTVWGTGNTTLITDYELQIDRLSHSGTSWTSYGDTSEGLRLDFADGSAAILAGISTATPDWMLYV